MRGVVLHSSVDELTVETPRSLHALFGPLIASAMWGLALLWLGLDMWSGYATLGLGVLVVPAVLINVFRYTRPQRILLERKGGLLWCNQEPLETARVEMRVVHGWFLMVPKNYRLSLWALTIEGKALELELGHAKSLVTASETAGVVDEFLHRRERRPLIASK